MHSIRTKVTLNYEEIKKDPQMITEIKPVINKYNWEENPSQKDDWKKFDKNNVTTSLNILCAKKIKNVSYYLCFKT